MKKFRFYLYITVSVILFFIVITFIATPIVVKNQTIDFLNNQIRAAQQDTKELALLGGEFMNDDVAKEKVIAGIQKGIVNSYDQTVFNSLIDWSGKILAHPDATLLGTRINENESLTSTIDNIITGRKLYDYLYSSKESTELSLSNIIHLELIPESDMIIAAHLNVNDLEASMNAYKNQAYTIFFITGLLSLLSLLMTTRVLSSYYEAQIAIKSTKIEDSVLNLNKLNTSLEKYQKNLLELKSETSTTVIEEKPVETSKQRLLTYVRNELVPVNIEDIAYIYVEHKITYLVCKDGRRSTSNESLDQIYASLDSQVFFRANRQIIVSIEAISKITKFGNNALKIQTHPVSEVDIVIGKNKAALFRQWLDL